MWSRFEIDGRDSEKSQPRDSLDSCSFFFAPLLLPFIIFKSRYKLISIDINLRNRYLLKMRKNAQFLEIIYLSLSNYVQLDSYIIYYFLTKNQTSRIFQKLEGIFPG